MSTEKAEETKAVAPKAPAKKKATAKKAAAVETPASEERSNRRKVRYGIVTSNKMDKTVSVKIVRRVQHPLYGKIVLRSEKFKAHDETNMCDIGDTVELMETRPLSREKRFRVTRIVEKVK